MRSLLILPVCLMLAACVTTEPGPDFFDSAMRAIDAAEKAGAEELAPVELRFARERLELARLAVEKRKFDEATLAIEQSEITSELAIEKSRTVLERRDANELRRANEVLREELQNTYGDVFE